jgi:putative membrane protein
LPIRCVRAPWFQELARARGPPTFLGRDSAVNAGRIDDGGKLELLIEIFKGEPVTDQSDHPPERFALRVTADSHFAWLRTRLSLERTLMSWVRTATALIGFGFTIVQFFERLRDTQGAAPALFLQAPRYLGLALIFAGIFALGISTMQYRSIIRYLWSENFVALAGIGREPYKSASFAVAILLLLIGIFAFFAVLLRLV